jgi:hypothetical protein
MFVFDAVTNELVRILDLMLGVRHPCAVANELLCILHAGDEWLSDGNKSGRHSVVMWFAVAYIISRVDMPILSIDIC